MIIDLRTRVWSSLDQLGAEVASVIRKRLADRWERLDGSAAAHERAMTCVDASAVLGFRSELLGANVPNELVAEFVARDSRRRIGFAGIDPLSSGVARDLDHAVRLGLSGVTISPAAQGYHPSHSLAMRLYERCAEMGLPIIVAGDVPLTRSAILDFARPFAFDEVARCVPELRLVIGDMGWPWTAETLALISKHQHVYADVSSFASRPWELYHTLVLAGQSGVMDKLLFGSGFPFEMPERAIESLYSLNTFTQGTRLPSIARAQLRAMVERSSIMLLGIEAEVGYGGEGRSLDDREIEPAPRRLVNTPTDDDFDDDEPEDEQS